MSSTQAPPASSPRPDVVGLSKLFLARAARSNLQFDHATEDERRILAAAPKPIVDPVAADYAVWRRAMLWIAAVVMAVNSVLKLISWIDGLSMEGMSGDVEDMWVTLSTLLFLAIPAATIMTGMAAAKWANLRASRRLARFGWMTLFLIPMGMAVIPWSRVMLPDLSLAQHAEVGGFVGILLFFYVGPAVISLCAGLIRSALTVKTLLPESTTPGWTAVIFGPFYGLLFISLLVIVNQVAGSALLLAALGCIVIAPLTYIRHSKQILRPHAPAEVTASVVSIRRKAFTLNLAGGALLAIWILDVPNVPIDVLGVAELFVTFFGSVLLLTVVASDFMVAMLCVAHRKGQEFFGTALADDLDRKFEALESVGLTRLDVSMKTTHISQQQTPPKT